MPYKFTTATNYLNDVVDTIAIYGNRANDHLILANLVARQKDQKDYTDAELLAHAEVARKHIRYSLPAFDPADPALVYYKMMAEAQW